MKVPTIRVRLSYGQSNGKGLLLKIVEKKSMIYLNILIYLISGLFLKYLLKSYIRWTLLRNSSQTVLLKP
ncbi:hypothetical protein H5410_065036 [Solanum commersonii]|uniref:Uncharacterized protein n=1 Tax=Solanum commersonii TaxID=4109 RepID=A0A9J5VXM7_SOLCO|nr:hypothetical protein H5410_065036 [Solanum commersonii]